MHAANHVDEQEALGACPDTRTLQDPGSSERSGFKSQLGKPTTTPAKQNDHQAAVSRRNEQDEGAVEEVQEPKRAERLDDGAGVRVGSNFGAGASDGIPESYV